MMNIFSLAVAFLLSHAFVACTPIKSGTLESRSAQTCADPSLATLFVSSFSHTRTAHLIEVLTITVDYQSTIGTADVYDIQNPSFLAWATPQPFTVPIHQIKRGDGEDFIFLPEVNGTVPSVSGWSTEGVTAYAYATQVCGSVPLLSVFNSATSDHWWTTNAADHARLVATGRWVDAGVPFYVLPLPYDNEP
ncbi:hypothetical protein JR316_0008826 [Psilocybe cubensis]|uniref:Uncharacterized protein n=2 Tax=Psilocybe cubensis TaxID=181762 RepID=A0ACB8GSH0_PSICU|nr:hypothetical protein JR316_0008826 [Psilocybe cubensis]KAH9478372.1 hypothetical protein JR316_0008826 [Psilocybe cubensis]